MKFSKFLAFALTLAFVSPAIAAEGPTKGSKFYQSRPSTSPEGTVAKGTPQGESAEDVSQITPAAGEQPQQPQGMEQPAKKQDGPASSPRTN